MKILVLGSGLMGPAAVYAALCQSEVEEVTVCDLNQASLEACASKLAKIKPDGTLSPVVLDLNDQAAASHLMRDHAAAVAALPRQASGLAARLAIQTGTPLVDLSSGTEEQLPQLKKDAEATGVLLIPGCGVEPGLTEIMARNLAERLDRVDELHIKCGGIPETPQPPLGYKIVFGGRRLPLRESEARIVENGRLKPVPRYSEPELVEFPGVGTVEAWHEGFMPWLLDLPALQNLRLGTQKTVRWPGYADKVTVLKEMGLLNEEPIVVDGVQVAPKKLLDALLYPKVQLQKGEVDITVFRVEVSGEKDGYSRRYKIDMVDRYDPVHDFTSMARTTAFTAAIVAAMIGRGEVQAGGMVNPEKVITGGPFNRLVAELAAFNICFELTTEAVEPLQGKTPV